MNLGLFIPIIILFLILFLSLRNNKTVVVRKLLKKKEEHKEMEELAKRFLGKECLIYSFHSNQYIGTIREVTAGAILIEHESTVEAINLDFVVRIREYPRNKKGKKKSVVLD